LRTLKIDMKMLHVKSFTCNLVWKTCDIHTHHYVAKMSKCICFSSFFVWNKNKLPWVLYSKDDCGLLEIVKGELVAERLSEWEGEKQTD
jgi:hypothetical protein